MLLTTALYYLQEKISRYTQWAPDARRQVDQINTARATDKVMELNGACQVALDATHSRLERLENGITNQSQWQLQHQHSVETRLNTVENSMVDMQQQVRHMSQLLTAFMNAQQGVNNQHQPVVEGNGPAEAGPPPPPPIRHRPHRPPAQPQAAPTPAAPTPGRGPPGRGAAVVAAATAAVAANRPIPPPPGPPVAPANALNILWACPRLPAIDRSLPKSMVELLSEWHTYSLGEFIDADRGKWHQPLRMAFEKRMYLHSRIRDRTRTLRSRRTPEEKMEMAAAALDSHRKQAGEGSKPLSMFHYYTALKSADPATKKRAKRGSKRGAVDAPETGEDRRRVQAALRREQAVRRELDREETAAFMNMNAEPDDEIPRDYLAEAPTLEVQMFDLPARRPGEREIQNHRDMSRHGRTSYAQDLMDFANL